METKNEIVHSKSIIGEKLYNTEKARKICETCGRAVFITRNYNYFSSRVEHKTENYATINGFYLRHYTIYSDIRPETKESVMEIIGKGNPDKYIELFGEVEEA